MLRNFWRPIQAVTALQHEPAKAKGSGGGHDRFRPPKTHEMIDGIRSFVDHFAAKRHARQRVSDEGPSLGKRSERVDSVELRMLHDVFGLAVRTNIIHD